MKENCCNCINIVLYSTGDLVKLYDYLFHMKLSLINVSHNLDNFIIRFYIDKSVFNVLYNSSIIEKDTEKYEKIKDLYIKSWEILKYLITHKQSEIYIYFCDELIKEKKLGYFRSFRFNSLFEDDVNISVFREADGIVSNIDCHNLRHFSNEKTDEIIFFHTFIEGNRYGKHYKKTCECDCGFEREFETHGETIREIVKKCDIHCMDYRYSKWLSIYSQMKYNYDKFSDDYTQYFNPTPINTENQTHYIKYLKKDFEKYRVDYDLLAGCFATKLKLKKEYIEKTIANIKLIYKECQNYYNNKKIKNKLLHNEVNILLENGYDEIFLNELFIFVTRSDDGKALTRQKFLKEFILKKSFETFFKKKDGLYIYDRYYVDYLFRIENFKEKTFTSQNLSEYYVTGYSDIMSKFLNCPGIVDDIEYITKTYFDKEKDLVKDGKNRKSRKRSKINRKSRKRSKIKRKSRKRSKRKRSKTIINNYK
jgi:hypothetical protein